MRFVSSNGWVFDDFVYTSETASWIAWLMASYDKQVQMLNTYVDMKDVNEAKPEDFGDGNETPQ